jgi:hypothetical protein
MYVYIYVCLYIYMYMCVCVYIYMYIYLYREREGGRERDHSMMERGPAAIVKRVFNAHIRRALGPEGRRRGLLGAQDAELGALAPLQQLPRQIR